MNLPLVPIIKSLSKIAIGFFLLYLISQLQNGFAFFKFMPALLSAAAWLTFESGKGKNILLGPWAREGSERAKAIIAMLPIWRFGFFLNLIVCLYAGLALKADLFFNVVALSPWTIFICCGIITAGLHLLAGDVTTLKTWMRFVHHGIFLLIGFVPFGIFCLLSLIILPILWIISLGDRNLFRARARALGQNTFKAILWYLEKIRFIRIRVQGLEYLTKGEIIVGNHISMFDIVCVLAFIKNCGTFVSTRFTKIPFIAPMISACGFIPIDRSRSELRAKALLEASSQLQNGCRLAIWPEGTRSKRGSIGPLESGAFKLAINHGAPIVPVVFTSSKPIFNNNGVWTPHESMIDFTISILRPINTLALSGTKEQKINSLKDIFLWAIEQRLSTENTPDWQRVEANCSLGSLPRFPELLEAR